MKNFTKTIAVLCSLMLFFAGFVYAEEGGNEGSSSPKSPAISSSTSAGGLVSSDNFLFTGSFASQIPITVPPGVNGIQPALSIAYNSSAGNSWCGLGWDLSLGVIQRSTKTGIPKYNDTDTFVYISQGGTQELVSIDNGEYRAKIESGFMKFLFDGSKWQVWDKSGMLYELGSTNDSRVHAPSDSNKIFSWYLDRVTDNNNNYMAISYVKDNSTYSPYPNGETYVSNQLYVAQIDYTGNSSTGFLPQRTVSFILEERPDILPSYEAGFFVLTAKRLKTIVTTVEIEQTDVPVNKYELSYSTSNASGKSLLEQVRYYGWNKQTSGWDEDTAFSAGVFDYKQDEEGLEDLQDWIGQDVNATSKGFFLADFNADARVDVARTGAEEGEFGNLGEPTGFELPYNKDTGQYFIWPFKSPEGGYLEKVSVYVKTATPTGWVPSPHLILKIKDTVTGTETELSPIGLQWDYKGWVSTVLVNTKEMVQGRDYEIHIHENIGVIGIGVDAEGPLYKIEFTSSRLEVWLSKGDSLEHSGVWKNFTESKTILKGDFNGDFKTDIARFVTEYTEGTDGYAGLEVYLTNDTGTGIDEANSGVWTKVSAGYRGFVFGDFNGDHKTDLAKYISDEYGICNGLEVLLSTGTGFEEPQVWIEEVISAGSWGFLFADFNKDGKTDIARSDAVWGNVGTPTSFETIGLNTTWDFTAVNTGQLDKISLFLKCPNPSGPYPPDPHLTLGIKDTVTQKVYDIHPFYPQWGVEKWYDLGLASGSMDIIKGRKYKIYVSEMYVPVSRGKDADGPLYKLYSSPYGFQVWLSNGNGFDDTGGWTDDAISFENILLGDFNGDSMVDMAQYNSKSENNYQGLKVWCSTGETLEYTGEWTDVNAGKDGFLLADINGDSKTDVIRTSVNGGNDGSPLYFNDIGDWLFTAPQTGYLKDFSVYIQLPPPTQSSPTPYITLQVRDAQTHEVLSDIGKSDLIWGQKQWLKKDLPEPVEVEKDKQYEIHITANLGVWKKGADDEGDLLKSSVSLLPGLDVWLSTGNGLEYAGLQRPDSGKQRKYLFGDFNGDAKIDLSQYIGEDEDEYKGLNVWLSKEAYPDLLSKVTNALGGSTEIEYVSSVGYDNTLLPFPVRTVQSLTRKDGMTGEEGWHVYISSYVW